MIKYIFFCLSFLILVFRINGEKFSFEGYRLLRITPKSEAHIQLLNNWENNPDFDVWNRFKNAEEVVDVLLSPKAFEFYNPLMKLANLSFSLVDENIQKKIDEEQKSMEKRANSKEAKNILGKYARYSEIINYISNLASNNPDIVTSYSAGGVGTQTFEKRELKVAVIKTNTSTKNVWIDCGIHAREWVSISTCIWFIDRLIKDYRNNDPVAVELLKYYEFHVLPLVNPDGYEYTHNTYRLWRKNRRSNVDIGSSCIGTDLNRNYGFKWMVAGASNNPCSDTYAGRAPDSEIETKAVEKSINDKLGKWDVFVTIHAYGNYWMIPYGYGPALPTDYNDLVSMSQIGAAALKSVYGTTYAIGSPPQLLYSAAGGSFDWTYAIAGIKYSMALELRPGQTGIDSNYGFTLPEDRAPLVGEETYVGLKAMINAIKNKNQ